MRSLVIVYLMFHTTLLPSLCYKTKIQAYCNLAECTGNTAEICFLFLSFQYLSSAIRWLHCIRNFTIAFQDCHQAWKQYTSDKNMPVLRRYAVNQGPY